MINTMWQVFFITLRSFPPLFVTHAYDPVDTKHIHDPQIDSDDINYIYIYINTFFNII